MKTYKVNDLIIEVNGDGGRIVKGLERGYRDERSDYGAMDGIERLLLALACAGVDIAAPEFKIALDTVLDAIDNNS